MAVCSRIRGDSPSAKVFISEARGLASSIFDNADQDTGIIE